MWMFGNAIRLLDTRVSTIQYQVKNTTKEGVSYWFVMARNLVSFLSHTCAPRRLRACAVVNSFYWGINRVFPHSWERKYILQTRFLQSDYKKCIRRGERAPGSDYNKSISPAIFIFRAHKSTKSSPLNGRNKFTLKPHCLHCAIFIIHSKVRAAWH